MLISFRIPSRVALTVALGLGAAVAFIVYLANGIVVGDLLGLPGRTHEIAIAQHRAGIGLVCGLLLQLGVAGALLSCLDCEDRYGPSRILAVVLVSLALTLTCGMAVYVGFGVFQ